MFAKSIGSILYLDERGAIASPLGKRSSLVATFLCEQQLGRLGNDAF
jgi:hypothetical protein